MTGFRTEIGSICCQRHDSGIRTKGTPVISSGALFYGRHALDEMPDNFEIRPYLMANRMGVKKMLLTEYNETETMELFRKEGREQGIDEANISNIRKIMSKMKFSAAKAMDFMDITENDQKRYAPLLREEGDAGKMQVDYLKE